MRSEILLETQKIILDIREKQNFKNIENFKRSYSPKKLIEREERKTAHSSAVEIVQIINTEF